jgi:hypothetical protein
MRRLLRSDPSGERPPAVISVLPPNMALQRTHRPRFLKVPPGVSNRVPVQEHAGTGRSLRSLGSPLNARPLDGPERPKEDVRIWW